MLTNQQINHTSCEIWDFIIKELLAAKRRKIFCTKQPLHTPPKQ